MTLNTDNIYVGKPLIPAVTTYKECGWIMHIDASKTIITVLFSDGVSEDIPIDKLLVRFVENKDWENYVTAAIKANVPITSVLTLIKQRIERLTNALVIFDGVVTSLNKNGKSNDAT